MLFMGNYQYKGFRAWKNGSELQFSNPDATKILYDYTYERLQNEGSFLLHYGLFMEDKNKNKALMLFEKAKHLINVPVLYAKTAQLNEQISNYKNAEENFLNRLTEPPPEAMTQLEALMDGELLAITDEQAT